MDFSEGWIVSLVLLIQHILITTEQVYLLFPVVSNYIYN